MDESLWEEQRVLQQTQHFAPRFVVSPFFPSNHDFNHGKLENNLTRQGLAVQD